MLIAAHGWVAALFNVGAREPIARKAFFASALVSSGCVQAVGIVAARVEWSISALVQVSARTAVANVARRANAFIRAVGINARGFVGAVVDELGAFVDCPARAHSSSANVPGVAFAQKRAVNVSAGGMLVAII